MSVDWHDAARDRLADIWVTSTPQERDVIERNVLDMEAQLAVNAQFLGESREGNERVWFYRPLVVWYCLIPGGLVQIVHIAKLRARQGGD